jgi:hypothetical protein
VGGLASAGPFLVSTEARHGTLTPEDEKMISPHLTRVYKFSRPDDAIERAAVLSTCHQGNELRADIIIEGKTRPTRALRSNR